MKTIWIDLFWKKIHKNIHIPLFDKYFYKNKKSELYFGDRISVQNDFIFKYEGSIILK
jgi:hypothetical protein